jgi:hypothetical protein
MPNGAFIFVYHDRTVMPKIPASKQPLSLSTAYCVAGKSCDCKPIAEPAPKYGGKPVPNIGLWLRKKANKKA